MKPFILLGKQGMNTSTDFKNISVLFCCKERQLSDVTISDHYPTETSNWIESYQFLFFGAGGGGV